MTTRRLARTAACALVVAFAVTSLPVAAMASTPPPSTLPPGPPTAELTARLRSALELAKGTPVGAPGRADVIELIEDLLDDVAEGKPVAQAKLQELGVKLSRLVSTGPGAPTTMPAPTPGTMTPPSTPGGSAPAVTAPASIAAVIEKYLEMVKTSSLPERTRRDLVEKLLSLRDRAARGELDAQKLAAALREIAGRLGAPGTSTVPVPPTEPPRAPTDVRAELERIRAGLAAADLPANVKAALLARVDTLMAKAAAGPLPKDAVRDLLEDIADAMPGDDKPGDGKPSDPDDDPAGSIPDGAAPPPGSGVTAPTPGQAPAAALAELARRVADVTERVDELGDSDAKRTALAALAALAAKLAAGTAPTEAEVRSAFELARNLVAPRTNAPERPAAQADAQRREKMRRAIERALEQLAMIETPASADAKAALEQLATRLAADEVPAPEEFDTAMRLVRAALEERPGARHAIVLAGVIASVQASNAPEDVKAALVAKLQLVHDKAASAPELDQHELVAEALREIRAERIAAAVARASTLIETLREAAAVTENAAADLLLSQALALLRPADGTPTIEALREVRSLVAAAIASLSTPSPGPDPGDDTPSDGAPDDPGADGTAPAGTLP